MTGRFAGALAVLVLLAGSLHGSIAAKDVQRAAEPNTRIPAGVVRYAPSRFPDRVVLSPAQDAMTGFAVAWRTDASVDAPLLEIAVAGDSPDIGGGEVRRIQAQSRALRTANGLAHHHRADVDGLRPDTLYAWRVQGGDTWSAWSHARTAASPGTPLTFLYFGDTQNQNVGLVTRVMRAARRAAPDARLALHAGDLVAGGGAGMGADDDEWGEWFEAGSGLPEEIATAPASGNHEHYEEFEDTPRERRVLGPHWPLTFALPRNGAPEAPDTTYWFDYQGIRFVVLDGTSALDLGTARAQAAWLDRVLAKNPQRWNIALIHQPMDSLRDNRDNAALREHLLPVLRRRSVDLMLQGHDHAYGRRPAAAGTDTPQLIVSVAGPKQYRITDAAQAAMRPVAEDTQLYQVLRLEGDRLRYEARTVTGGLYDAFEIVADADGRKRVVEIIDGRMPERRCAREQTLKGRSDRCWE